MSTRGTKKAVGALTGLLILGACAGAEGGDELGIAAGFYPLEFLTQEIAGRNTTVANVTPSGAEPHDIELTSGQLRAMVEADLLVYLGGGFQPAVEEIAADLGDKAFDVAEVRPPLGESEQESEAAEDDARDPHLWLDPMIMSDIAEELAVRLGEIDPENATAYSDRADALANRLEALDEDFAAGLRRCERREFVTSHEAFGYLARRYDLTQIGVSGLDPEVEPSPQRVAEVADYVEEHDVTTIFFEELLPADIAQTIAKETGAKTAILNPLESEPDSGDYFDEMRANLRALRDALNCA
ncbi:MAG: metal ABC transporter substrate-binding protein [Actinomycetota bacterium]|nr:metal ABC transporter substrate-binding protein [Actinomycetota bacterium]